MFNLNKNLFLNYNYYIVLFISLNFTKVAEIFINLKSQTQSIYDYLIIFKFNHLLSK